MVQLTELVSYADDLLEVDRFSDYCPNGLQVEGRAAVGKLVSGVTASLALIEAAIGAGADAIVVHHGYFWRGEDARVTGMKKQRLRRLLDSDTSLLAYHLPLDAHPLYGNNAQLGEQLGLVVEGRFGSAGDPAIGLHGRLARPASASDFARHVAQVLGRRPLLVAGAGDEALIDTVAWCSGAAQGYIEQAVALGVDAYLTGEISEQTVHVARECGIQFIAAGHHATERYGARALGRHLAANFSLEHEFIDIDNPA
ncbi:MAG: Nif3-like dinuclear metal center hexameric protein [Pseudomonadota bacterium]|nr:MAG: Nif3-like dinuclear metal center hexameric protein [Pseudomonadota bacterium]